MHTIKTALTGSPACYGAVYLELLELSTDERLEVAVLGTVRPMRTDSLDVVFVCVDGNAVTSLADEGFELLVVGGAPVACFGHGGERFMSSCSGARQWCELR
jgi:hypothetical protein